MSEGTHHHAATSRISICKAGVAELSPSRDRKSTRLNSSHGDISYAVFCLKKKNSFWSEVRFFERLSYVGSKQIEAARFIRHDVYDAVGGHDGTLVAYEEHDLHNKVSSLGKIARIEGASEWHIGEPKKLAEIVITSWYYGKNAIRYVRR